MTSFIMNIKKIYICVLIAFAASGCATVKTKKDYIVGGFPEKGRPGVYHKVKKGETLWSIAKAYDVSMKEVIDANRIPNVARVEENQLPDAEVFPVEAHITAFDFSSIAFEIAIVMPRSLKEPVGFKPSNL
jgi:uncharacterized protein YceK